MLQFSLENRLSKLTQAPLQCHIGLSPYFRFGAIQTWEMGKLWVLGQNDISRNCILRMRIWIRGVPRLQVIYVERLYGCEWHFSMMVEYEAACFTEVKFWATCSAKCILQYTKSDMTLGNVLHEICYDFGALDDVLRHLPRL